MLHSIFLHGNSPVRGVIADRCRNLESAWQFGIYHYLVGFIKAMGKLSFSLAVTEHIVGNVFLCLVSPVKVHLVFTVKMLLSYLPSVML